MAKKVLLTILDGVGERSNGDFNAVKVAHPKTFERLLANNLHSLLKTSGEDVGLPDGQMGNSEVGHMNIGAGRVVYQDLGRIHLAIKDGSFAQNPFLLAAIQSLKKSGGALHLMGLLSDGGVHAHIHHILSTATLFATAGVQVYLHAFTDGRDTAPHSATRFLKEALRLCKEYPLVSIATVMGRYYAMDRDHRWERTELAFRAIVDAKGPVVSSNVLDALQASFDAGISDEFVKPIVHSGYTGMHDGDGFFMANFRSDRARQLLSPLVMPDFIDFPSHSLRLACHLGMTNYEKVLDTHMTIIYPRADITMTLGEIIAQAGKTQFRVAETEKYPHVTFFFNGGREDVFDGESRCVIPSPKVATYDLQPEMSALAVCQEVVHAITHNSYDFIVVNFANGDMVGHTGNMEASTKAVATVDACLATIETALQTQGDTYAWIITADHGNCEEMWNYEENCPHTQHTTNPVVCILMGGGASIHSLADGRLADLAPTILHLMGIPIPSEMTGRILVS